MRFNWDKWLSDLKLSGFLEERRGIRKSSVKVTRDRSDRDGVNYQNVNACHWPIFESVKETSMQTGGDQLFRGSKQSMKENSFTVNKTTKLLISSFAQQFRYIASNRRVISFQCDLNGIGIAFKWILREVRMRWFLWATKQNRGKTFAIRLANEK